MNIMNMNYDFPIPWIDEPHFEVISPFDNMFPEPHSIPIIG